MSCGRRRAKSCPARLCLVGWAAPEGAAHVVRRGYPGSYPHRCPRCLDDSTSGLEPTSGVLKVHIEVLMLIGKRKGHIDLDFMMI